jgi:enoyl-CoA hydratase
MYSDILVDDQQEIRVVRLNRPEARNSISRGMAEELLDALAEFGDDSKLRGLVLTGAGDVAFCAGGDIKEMEKMDYRKARSFAVLAHRVVNSIEGTGKPVVSAVNGLALGAGCDLALACDLCLASENAKFGVPSLRVGVINPFGGMSRLVARVGVSKAKSMIFTGALVGAAEARSIGLVHSVLPAPGLVQGAISQTQAVIQERSPVAFALAKKLLVQNSTSRGADAREIEYYARCFRTSDQKEGARAFREKRDPVFEGR